MKRGRTILLVFFGIVLGGLFAVNMWLRRQLTPTESRPPEYLRLEHPEKLGAVLKELNSRGIVRNPDAMQLLSWYQRRSQTVRLGTYQLAAGMNADDIFQALTNPIRLAFRFPETNWARRSANLLQRANICQAKDYLALVNRPTDFQSDVSFPLPPNTLEGYLYPDTYEVAPISDPKGIIERQLKAFDSKVVKRLGPGAADDTVVIKASLVELETGTDEDRAMIAGVIENRLKKGIPLQIDAGIEYALGKWRRLYFKDYKNIKSPYNLYLHKGLPPTPICSPSLKSIEAVLHPAQHNYIYYVALPNGHSIYAATPAEHQHNIRLRKQALLLQNRLKAGRLLSPAPKPTDQKGGKHE